MGAGPLRAIADTGPLVAAAHHRDDRHAVAKAAIAAIGRELIILDTVLVEADAVLSSRSGRRPARLLLDSVAREVHSAAFLTPGLLKRAVALDAHYADLNLGLVDASIMAYAERHDLPILTFDFRDFRATEGERGPWHLVLSEEQLERALG